jgi:nucleotide-binding universal stress UspA family protein
MYARILVPIDGSSAAQRGLDEAIALARRLGSSLRVLNVAEADLPVAETPSTYAPSAQLIEDWRIAGERLVPDAVARARSQGVSVDGALRCDPTLRVCDVIVQEATRTAADLIVMGSHGHRDPTHLALGRNAELVLQTSPVPVLLVRAADTAGR